MVKGPRREAKHAEGKDTEEDDEDEDEEIPDRISAEDAYLFPIVSHFFLSDPSSSLFLIRLVPLS